MKSQTPPSKSSSSYHLAVTRVAVGQICRSVGFKSTYNSVLSIIIDVARKYLHAVASVTVTAANAAGRTDSNVVDIVAALDYIHSNTGFTGESDVNLGFYNFGPLVDVMKFVNYNDEIPFAKPLRRQRLGEQISYSCVGDGESERNHVPKWLPLMSEIRGMELRKRELWPCFNEGNKKMRVVEGKSREIEKRQLLSRKRGKVRFKIHKSGVGFKEWREIFFWKIWSENQECSSGGDNKKNVTCYVRRKRVRKLGPLRENHDNLIRR